MQTSSQWKREGIESPSPMWGGVWGWVLLLPDLAQRPVEILDQVVGILDTR